MKEEFPTKAVFGSHVAFWGILVGTIWFGLAGGWYGVGAFLGTGLGVAGLAMGVLTAFWIEEHRPNRKRWCPDCGKQMVKMRSQHGFEKLTGKPVIDSVLRCPDWRYTHNPYDGCGKKVTTIPSAQCHDPYDVTCSVCLEVMVEKKLMTKQEAALLR